MAINKKFNTEAVNDYPPIRFEIWFERKFPIVGLYFLTLPVETLWNLCPWKSYLECEWRVCVSFTDALVLFIFNLYYFVIIQQPILAIVTDDTIYSKAVVKL